LATWNGTTLLPFGNMFRGIAQAVVVNGSDVFVGGVCYFTGTGDPANNIARWDGANWSSLPPGGGTNNGTNGPIHALAMGPNNYLYVGGTFTTAGGGSANRIAKYNLTTSAWSSLPSGGGFNNGVIGGISPRVNAIAAIGNDIYVGGSFTTAGLGSANNVARFDESINIWSSLPFGGGANNGVNSSVYAIMTNGPNQIYFGGFFSTAGGGSAKSVAKWNVGGATWSSLPSGGGANNGTNGNVRTIAISGTGVHVGGFFSTAGGSSANNIALWNGATWTSLPVGGGSNNGTTEIVRSMAFGGPHLYVGGDFTSAGGKTAYRVARWNGCDWFPMGSGANLFVLSVAANATPGSYGTNVFIGGEFSTTGGKTAENFGHWNPAFYDDPNCGQRAENSTTAHLGVAPIPEKLRLYQNHPNPFNPSTTIRYDLPEDGNVSLKIYDMLGREVMSVVDGFETAGYHQTTVDGTNLASGVYFYRLTAGSFSDMKRLLLLK